MRFQNKVFIAGLFITLAFTGAAYSGLIINFEGMGYDEVQSFSNSISNLPVTAIMIGSPFKGYEFKKMDTPVYDFYDIGGSFRRGSMETALGSPDSFSNLVDYFHERRIEVYSKINLFVQKEGFNRNLWDSYDFTWDSFTFGDLYYFDINNENTRTKLGEIIYFLSSLPVDKWVIDLREIPEKLIKGYKDFLGEKGGGKFIILEDTTNDNDFRMSSGDYDYIRENIFIIPDPHLMEAKTYGGHPGWIHFIDSESLSVNNYASLSFLLSREKNVAVPAVFVNSYGSQLLRFFLNSSGFSVLPVSDDKLVIYNNEKIAAFNFSSSFSFWKTENLINKRGFYKSIFGGSTLTLKSNEMEFFMLPDSAAYWVITN